REQTPFGFPASTKAGGKVYDIEIHRQAMAAGDYSLLGYGGAKGEAFGIAIERKNSPDEIAGNFTAGRERFEREFLRLSLYAERAIVICGCTRGGILSGLSRMRSRINRKAL